MVSKGSRVISGFLSGLLITVVPGSAIWSGVAHAEEEEPERLLVTGSRRVIRSDGDTLTPLDIISGSDFSRQGTSEIDTMLRTVLPSYNVGPNPIGDVSTIIRPASLRGLSPDHTLVLVNGKRRHRGAAITLLGSGLANGAQGPDVGALPTIALERVEVLRDGAAAQYGSDAIAGVLNFVLKDASDGVLIDTKIGSSYAGDGEHRQVATNLGLPLGDSGFMNYSLEWVDKNPTVRSVRRPDALSLIEGGNTDVRTPYAQIWGDPDLDDDIRSTFNLEYTLNDKANVYAFGNYSERTVEGGFYFRNPDSRAGVYVQDTPLADIADSSASYDETSTDSVRTRLVGDRDQAENGADRTCPTDLFVLGHGPTQEAALAAFGGDQAALETYVAAQEAAVAGNSNCWTFNDALPGGFTPSFGGEVEDYSLVVGVGGEFDSGLTYDTSVSYGSSELLHFIHSLNASQGVDALPDRESAETRLDRLTFFDDIGTVTQTEIAYNLDLTYPMEIEAFASPLNVAVGFEWREEEFEVEAGGFDASDAGIYTFQGFGTGSNGFAGYSPAYELEEERSNIALYLDLEADISERLTAGAALRWEDFEQFGTTTNWKVSGLYRVTDSFRFRASANTGFRVPTVGQNEFRALVTALQDGRLVSSAQVSPGSPLAVELGAVPLVPEESDSFTLGVIFDLGDSGEVTLDYYQIEVEDRLSRTDRINVSQLMDATRDHIGPECNPSCDSDQIADLLGRSGFGEVGGDATVGTVNYYVNDFDTRTRGVDLVYTTPVDLTETGTSEVIVSGNWTKTSVEDFNPESAFELRRRQLEDSLPNVRFNVSLTHDEGEWRGLVRARYFGSGEEFTPDALPGSSYDSDVLFDVEVVYSPLPGWEIVAGAENVFDNNPTSDPTSLYQELGAKYPEVAPTGFLGGFYYAGLRYEF